MEDSVQLICPKCGTVMNVDKSAVCTSMPQQYRCVCPLCGYLDFIACSEVDYGMTSVEEPASIITSEPTTNGNLKDQFLKWFADVHGITFNDRFNIIDAVFEWLQVHENQFISSHSTIVEDEKLEERIPDFVSMEVEGIRWFYRTHYCRQLDKNRQLKCGDAIITHNSGYPYGVDNFMIIGGFDFDSDFAARAYIGRSPYWKLDAEPHYTIYGNYATGDGSFRFATEDEIRAFFEECRKSDEILPELDDNVAPVWFKMKYGKYYREVDTTPQS